MINSNVIQVIHDFVWGIPLITLILIVSIVLTFKLKFIQITKLPKAIKSLVDKDKCDNGDVSTFQALCISLSATIGTGNITGVASAITIGGAGSLFWMIITAFFGMAVKYSEGYLAVKYRKRTNERIIGGPYAYIEYGLGTKYKILAKMFALFGAICAIIGIGTLTQINGIVDAAKNVFEKQSIETINILGSNVSVISVITGGIITFFTALTIIGGVKRVGRVCEILVPIMALIYIITCIIILLFNVNNLDDAIIEIFKMAFTSESVIGGISGITIKEAIQQGVSKGIFSNEAGLGSAPIATATVKSNDAVKQGMVAMTSTFFGTMIICVLTGLVVVVTKADKQNLSGIMIADYAFSIGLPLSSIISSIIILVSITCFAFTSIIGWNLYGIRCLDYLTDGNKKIEVIYQWVYILILFIGSFLEVSLIWNIAEIMNALMAIPNLIGIYMLKDKIVLDTCKYFKKIKT